MLTFLPFLRIRQSFRGLCSAEKLEYASQISSFCSLQIHSWPISTLLFALELELNGALWQDSLPSGFHMKLSFSIWFFFWFLKSWPFFCVLGLMVVTSSCCWLQIPTLYTVLTPLWINNLSPNYPTVRMPAISCCDTVLDVCGSHRDTQIPFNRLVPSC